MDIEERTRKRNRCVPKKNAKTNSTGQVAIQNKQQGTVQKNKTEEMVRKNKNKKYQVARTPD